MGYKRLPDGSLAVIPDEAETVRRIFRDYIGGDNPSRIARALTGEGIPTPSGGSVWSRNAVLNILKNEKYAGMAILQKTYTVDFLTKKRAKNDGFLPKYNVSDSHEAIIPPAVFELAAREIERRRAASGRRRTV